MKKLKIAIILVAILSINLVAGVTYKSINNSNKTAIVASGTVTTNNDGDPWI